MLCVWLYGFMTGVRSCRKLETACREQLSFLWLTGWQHPDHNTLWRFYKGHEEAMRKPFKQHGENRAGDGSSRSGGAGRGWHQSRGQRVRKEES